MLVWNKLVWHTNEELIALDLALINLACAAGLPGSELIDLDLCLSKLDSWAYSVRTYTDRLVPHFHHKRADYHNSEAYFRSLCLITLLQRDMGVCYNLAKTAEDASFDLADCFIHGVIQGSGGTCATMPVTYAAVGRRLGYPIQLVSARGKSMNHLFARWDDPHGERLNIEATNKGMSCFPDDYYRTGRYEITADVEEAGQFLQSQTPKMELAGFLVERAYLLRDHGDLRQCVDAWAWAASLVPENKLYLNTLKMVMNDWAGQLKTTTPPGFPHMWIVAPYRYYQPALPPEIELDILGLAVTEYMLTHAEWKSKWWNRLRRGERLEEESPVAAMVKFGSGGSCDLTLRFACMN
ncbi:MAG TPA: transglutaminase family protein [Gemmataceae bacterium]|nr:transglutaminase family protein [Gemmataceae bacterium]